MRDCGSAKKAALSVKVRETRVEGIGWCVRYRKPEVRKAVSRDWAVAWRSVVVEVGERKGDMSMSWKR